VPISRRDFLKLSLAGLGAAALPVETVQAGGMVARAPDSASMLYDSVKCVGCRACQMACKMRSNLPPELDPTKTYEAPMGLSANTWTLIQLYKENNVSSFVKHQCMHCIDPACVSVCPVGALEKLESGPVIYHKERCIGCRYCMAACPFSVPKSQWDKPLPLIQKCDFCADRLAKGEQPACSDACPTGALIYGKRQEMLDTAHSRLQDNPKYDQYVYGESEAGGTSMLYISNTDYTNLGFPTLDGRDLPAITWPYMRAVPAIIAVMVTLSTGIYLRTHHNNDSNGHTEPKKEE
jgi:formate dehydrogenase iron-sulfur subunit